jgi:hypothetical protein
MTNALEDAFFRFMSEQGAESLDDLLPSSGREKGDFLVFDRATIVEVKSLTVNRVERMQPEKVEAFQRICSETDLWKVTIKELPFDLADLEQFSKPIKEDLRKGNSQIRETRKTLQLPSAPGITVLLNDRIEDAIPQLIQWTVLRELSKDPQASPPPYEQTAGVWCISEGFIDRRIRAFAGTVLHQRAVAVAGVEPIIKKLNDRWSSYRGYPLGA